MPAASRASGKPTTSSSKLPASTPTASSSRPAYITVLQNGVLIQNHTEILGATSYIQAPKYAAHPPKLPLTLQAHGNPVRYRNIWIRELDKKG